MEIHKTFWTIYNDTIRHSGIPEKTLYDNDEENFQITEPVINNYVVVLNSFSTILISGSGWLLSYSFYNSDEQKYGFIGDSQKVQETLDLIKFRS